MTAQTDRDEIRRFADLLWRPGEVREMRVIIRPGRTVSGYYDSNHLDAFVRDAAAWSGKAPGVYVTINPVQPALLARAANHVTDYAKATTSDADILCRRFWPLDFDPTRPAGISASEEEHAAAIEAAAACGRWLIAQGVPTEAITSADSGNGAHLLVACDLPNDAASYSVLHRASEAAALLFDDDRVHVDPAMCNAARIWKVYGTLVCKGDNISERPHRVARLRRVPAVAA